MSMEENIPRSGRRDSGDEHGGKSKGRTRTRPSPDAGGGDGDGDSDIPVAERNLSKESSANSSDTSPTLPGQPPLPQLGVPSTESTRDGGEVEVEDDGDQDQDEDDSQTTPSIDINNYRNNMSNLVALAEQLEAANAKLDKKLEAVDEQLAKKQEQITSVEAKVRELQFHLQELDTVQKEQAADLIAAAGGEDEASMMARVDEIENQIKIYEQLKADEKAFKRNCNTELERLTNMLEQTKKQADDDNISDTELQAQLEKAERKVEAGKEELGNINRKLALIHRQIEQIPHRVELREYRLRFTELYNQVSATHRQTKQYYSLYNSLEDSKRYLEKEHSLLNSIIDSYQEVGSTAAGREEFLKQLSHIHDGMKETCSKVDRRYKSEKVVVDKLQQDLQHLLDQKVNYEKCLKELDSDCKLNERLLAQLKQLEAEEQLKTAAAAGAASPTSVHAADSS